MSASRTVSDMFSIKECHDLETEGRGRSRSLKMAQLVGHCKYIALCCTIFELSDVE